MGVKYHFLYSYVYSLRKKRSLKTLKSHCLGPDLEEPKGEDITRVTSRW